MNKFYAVVTHHSVINTWEKLSATTLAGAKREATREFGSGYHGHVINLVDATGVSQDLIDRGYLNELPTYTKVIGPGNNKWNDPV